MTAKLFPHKINLFFLGMIQRICEVKHKTSRQHQELGACNNFGGATRATSFLSFSAMSMTEWIRLNCEIILSLFLNFSFETTRRFIFLVSQLKSPNPPFGLRLQLGIHWANNKFLVFFHQLHCIAIHILYKFKG